MLLGVSLLVKLLTLSVHTCIYCWPNSRGVLYTLSRGKDRFQESRLCWGERVLGLLRPRSAAFCGPPVLPLL